MRVKSPVECVPSETEVIVRHRSLILLLVAALCATNLHASSTLMLRTPDISSTSIVFSHAGDLW